MFVSMGWMWMELLEAIYRNGKLQFKFDIMPYVRHETIFSMDIDKAQDMLRKGGRFKNIYLLIFQFHTNIIEVG